MADVLGKVLRRLGPKKVKEMDEAAKRAAGSPGFDDDTLSALKELDTLKKKEKRGTLTASEEQELDRLNRKMIRQSAAERAEDMPKAQKNQRLTDKQKKEAQESLNFSKGGMANCGASVKPAGGSRNK